MSEHYTLGTVSASAYCAKCGKFTQHRVDNRRRGPCIACMDREAIDATRRKLEAPRAVQGGLF
jgi:ribosomal protein L44E